MRGQTSPTTFEAFNYGDEASRLVPREVLPLPRSSVERVRGSQLDVSRGVKQRLGKREGFELDCDRAAWALNSLYLHQPQPPVGTAADSAVFVSLGQRHCLDWIRASVAALGAPPPEVTPAEALTKLRVASWYDVDSAALGSYSLASVSLPSGSLAPVPLEDLWGAGGSDMIRDFVHSRLLPSSEADSRLTCAQVAVPYSDPKLRRVAAFEEFVRALHQRSMVDFSFSCKERVEAFFVLKNPGSSG